VSTTDGLRLVGAHVTVTPCISSVEWTRSCDHVVFKNSVLQRVGSLRCLG